MANKATTTERSGAWGTGVSWSQPNTSDQSAGGGNLKKSNPSTSTPGTYNEKRLNRNGSPKHHFDGPVSIRQGSTNPKR